MRGYVLPVACAALAALAVAGIAILARADAGPEAPPAQTGEAAARIPRTPAAPPSPADEGPTPTPTREAAIAVAAPAPESACLAGTAVASPADNPGLAADCSALLRARDALGGTGSLNWRGDRPIAEWDGVATGGDPPRVTGIDLRNKGLTGGVPPELGELSELAALRLDDNDLSGEIPRGLGRLPLSMITLANNDLTGCIPSPLEDVANNDMARINLPWCLRYNALDSTGAVAAAGSWAILDAGGPAGSGGAGGASGSADATPAPPAVLTTWEDLRSDAATLRVHQTDAGGTSWATEFGAVEAGDLIEWRKADDCWVRYRVTGAPTRPASGSSRWEFPVEWMTYAGTGAGCTGAVGAATVLRADEEPVHVTSHAMAALSLVAATPVRHGPWLLHPLDWSDRSVFEEQVYHQPTMAALGGTQSDPDAWLPYPRPVRTTNLAEAKMLQFWRDPALPAGATFSRAESGLPSTPPYGYCAWYSNPAVDVCVFFLLERPHYTTVYYQGDHGIIKEARVIDGRPALVEYSPPGPRQLHYFSSKVWVFDPATGLVYYTRVRNTGFDIEAVVEIARSLMPAAGAP